MTSPAARPSHDRATVPAGARQPRRLLPLWRTSAPSQQDTAVRDAIQRLVVANGRYHRGYRYIARQLRNEGLIVNHKRVLRLMRQDNLLCLRRKSFVVTTDSRHNLPVYPNLAARSAPSSVNQLWRADITYIRLRDRVHLPGRGAGCVRRAASSVGRWAARWKLRWRCRHSPWRCVNGGPRRAGCIIPIAACSTPARIHRYAEAEWRPNQHEPQGQSVRQRPGGALHSAPALRAGL